jgi:hypothetical protein
MAEIGYYVKELSGDIKGFKKGIQDISQIRAIWQAIRDATEFKFDNIVDALQGAKGRLQVSSAKTWIRYWTPNGMFFMALRTRKKMKKGNRKKAKKKKRKQIKSKWIFTISHPQGIVGEGKLFRRLVGELSWRIYSPPKTV